MEQAIPRRTVLRLLTGGALGLAGGHTAAAGGQRIQKLLRDAQALPLVSQRIELISRSLMGTRYASHTLIGGPRKPEVFLVRDDAFDCVTYCELVLAAAVARDLERFESSLRRIRYRNGVVDWRERNHYFADWCARSIENGFCRPVVFGEPVRIAKDVSSEPAVGRRRWVLDAMAGSTLLSHGQDLSGGEIVGFVSRRSSLDYFHTGFVAFGRRGQLLLRHASSTHGRVVQEPMARFLQVNGTKYVTLLRPEETAPAVVQKS